MQFITLLAASLALVSAATIFDHKLRPIAIGPFTDGCEITCKVKETFALNGKCYCGDAAVSIANCLEKMNPHWPLINSSNMDLDPDTIKQSNTCAKGPDGKEFAHMTDVYQLGDLVK